MRSINLGIMCHMTKDCDNKYLSNYSSFKRYVLDLIKEKNIRVKSFFTGGYKHNYRWVTMLAKDLSKPCKCFHQRDKLGTILLQIGNKANMILYL